MKNEKTLRDVLPDDEPFELTDLFNDRVRTEFPIDLEELLNNYRVKYNGVELTSDENKEVIEALKLLA
ncbi:hypothetical protein [Aneurinibacillus tyrosinisolvens]|uniref:hypothetical protein n=1 Tax=Aneurinibacillus tyrosinisolvens TaxID=1443435 RepID=UPI00063F0AEF|nr:hypothetical protein [Aneurinibacillus tyrosinisolvens]